MPRMSAKTAEADEADEGGHPPLEPEGEHRDRVAVGADGHEAGDAHVDQAGVAEVHREPERGERVADRRRAEDR